MTRISIPLALVTLASLLSLQQVWAEEKIKIGNPVRTLPISYLPVLAGQEKGIFQRYGYQGEWLPFQAGPALYRAAAAGEVNLGLTKIGSMIQAVAAGVQLIVTSQLTANDAFFLWVRGDSPLNQPTDLKGRTYGVSRFGDSQHAYARMILRSLGIEKEVKFVAVGGIREMIATLRTGAINVATMTPFQVIELKLKGDLKELAEVSRYHPKDWVGDVAFVRKDFVASRPETVKKLMDAIWEAIEASKKDAAWSIAKMKEINGYSDPAARSMFQLFTSLLLPTGTVNKQGLANVLAFFVENGIVPKDKAPTVEGLVWAY